jgi:hypothetical protein
MHWSTCSRCGTPLDMDSEAWGAYCSRCHERRRAEPLLDAQAQENLAEVAHKARGLGPKLTPTDPKRPEPGAG